ncbi:TMEM175 family protein [Methanobacterium sp. ACI-7]|uniref:TMEM175 family protein n=1 Tax=unclassified Methanobacterium TaxID=2627676 RepID=UPI0039C07170
MSSLWETTSRIETLVDGIFAIAMTLLVLNIDVPQIMYPASNAVIIQSILDLSTKFFNFALSFILLAIFWRVNHQQFYKIKKADGPFLWITVIWLLFVVLVPFSTSLTGEYGYLESAQVFFNLNLFLIGIMSASIWYYATGKKYVNDLTPEEIRKTRRTNLILPIVSLIAIGIAFISPSWCGLTYAFIPIVKKIMDRL